jgi:leucyl aminopeptidase
MEHLGYPEGEWVQVALAPSAVWLYVARPMVARYGIEGECRSLEEFRRAGCGLERLCKAHQIPVLQTEFVAGVSWGHEALLEGLLLSSYRFDRYLKSTKQPRQPKSGVEKAGKSLAIHPVGLTRSTLTPIIELCLAVFKARDLVNEPQSVMGAVELAQAFRAMGKDAGFKVSVWNKSRIQQEGMGGLMAVNLGSVRPPTFTMMEYKPAGAVNKQPIVLVGKGVVYDTGGLSLKPTPGSMDSMKCDMAGAAAVGATMQAIARNRLPVYVIALVPATDNRPGGDAYVPGDIIQISDGTTVEVLNTDAEGRLILADALHYAKRYKPELVVDLATLTGSAVMALSSHATPCMGTAERSQVQAMLEAGFRCYERIVSIPIWEEYGEMIKTSVADLKNIGGREAGAITAAKFLEHFTDYPWLHLDIAGPAFLDAESSYRGKHGTGHGVRLLYTFLCHRAMVPKSAIPAGKTRVRAKSLKRK